MADVDTTSKVTEDPNFKAGVMSPNSKQTFAEIRLQPSANTTQKLVLDEETFELAFLKCSMCRERYNLSNKSPRLLPCHHTYCLECILKFFKAETDYRASLIPGSGMMSLDIAVPVMCPNCRVTFLTSENGINQLTVDHRIIQLLDFIGTTEKHEATYCPKHTMQCLTFFCESHKQPVCRDCTVLDHKTCVTAQQVLDIKTAKDKYLPIIEKGVKDMDKEIASLKEKREESEQMLSSCQEGDQDLIKHIKESFAKLRDALNEREQALLDLAKCQTGNGKEDVEGKIKRIADKEKEADELAETLKAFKDFDNLSKLHAYYEKIQSYKTETAFDRDTIKPNAPKSKFINRDEQTLVSRIEKYGELQSQDRSYNGANSFTTSSYTTSSGLGSSYSSYGNSYSGSRYSGSSLSSTAGTTYSSRYTPRTGYRY